LKKFTAVLLTLSLVLSLSACFADSSEDYISGEAIPIEDLSEIDVERYENQFHGIIIEYPVGYERIGNLDADGFITFDGEGNSIAVYIPDSETDLEMSEQDYATNILRLPVSADAQPIVYGKTSGYKTRIVKDDKTTLEFIVKGLYAFYRFSFTCDTEKFSEELAAFRIATESIRIDDGVFTSLYRMSAKYSVLLQYATSQQYSTDANYANHCLNNYEISNDEAHLQTAIDTFSSIKEELGFIINHEREEEESFEDLWVKIVAEAERMSASCDEALAAIESRNIDEAQHISRVAYTYELCEYSQLLISAINTEIGEYR